jgi:AcrR family transcriptional regulator
MDQKPESDEKRRPYHSPVRQRQAEETRRRILVAARDLFERQGYAVTTLEAIAQLAEVSPKTIEAVFGSKHALLAEVINPEAVNVPAQELIEELRATQDPSRKLKLVAQITRQSYEPVMRAMELLQTASVVAPELAGLSQQIELRRRHRQAWLSATLHEQGALRGDLSLDEATDMLWALTSYDIYCKLVVAQHWKPERYETWLAQLLIERLLASR